jgi:uncharacterized protein (DUF427 family)
MAIAHRIETNVAQGHVRVELGGEVLAETDRAVELHEKGLPVRLYIPREDVNMDLLTPSNTTSRCPWKGKATYFNGPGVQDVAWTYEEPIDGREDITGHLSFYDAKVDVTTT